MFDPSSLPHDESWAQVETLKGRNRRRSTSGWIDYEIPVYENAGKMLTQNHGKRIRNGLLGSENDVGGYWDMEKHRLRINPIQLRDDWHEGPLYGSPPVHISSMSGIPSLTDDELKGRGTRAIGIAAPTNPSVNLPVALGEILKDGLPKMFGSGLAREKTSFLRGSSSEYLNYEFGWKPLISDVQKFARSVIDADDIIQGYLNGANRKVRRRLADQPLSQSANYEGVIGLRPTERSVSGEGTASYFSEQRTWFSGAFKYHIPMGNSVADRLYRYRSYAGKLFGIRLTPDTLWNLMPWSWAIDWFVDVGGILTNVSNLGQDGLAMQYGYSMTSVYTHHQANFRLGHLGGSYDLEKWRKMRVRASPYGFDLTWDGFSTRQLAIVAALGITRSGRG